MGRRRTLPLANVVERNGVRQDGSATRSRGAGERVRVDLSIAAMTNISNLAAQFHCNTQSIDRIAWIRETSSERFLAFDPQEMEEY